MRHDSHLRAQQGYTLIELMISIIIALFLMAGLVTLVMHTRNSSTSQAQVQQLQENERIALTVLTNVIQEAGYYPDPTTNTASSLGVETSAAAGNFAAGQAIMGPTSGAVIGARFAAPKYVAGSIANTIITCAGTNNTDATNVHWFTNVFQIGTAADGTSYLQCLLSEDGGTPQTVNLVPGLQAMQVWFGVTRTPNGVDTNVNTYVQAANMNASDWANITSVKIRLYFQLPQYGFSGGQVNSAASSAAVTNGTQYVERVIGIMNRTGVNT